uniref:Uncharacterized protein n=1 Tax=Arundo donax TaxID=35708 RepID=A0A0A9HCP5_ARUDO
MAAALTPVTAASSRRVNRLPDLPSPYAPPPTLSSRAWRAGGRHRFGSASRQQLGGGSPSLGGGTEVLHGNYSRSFSTWMRNAFDFFQLRAYCHQRLSS